MRVKHYLSIAAVLGASLSINAHAQRPSLTGIDDKLDGIKSTVEETNAVVNEGPIPIDACGILDLSGSYVLTDNLATAGSGKIACLFVDDDFVTIDLAGFVITGDGTGVGIASTQTFSATTVRNGTITNFNDGVTLRDHAVVESIRTIGNERFGILVGESSLVRDNILDNNNSVGIYFMKGSTITGNTGRKNGRGIQGDCPSNLIGNTLIESTIDFDIFLNSPGCNATDNVGSVLHIGL